MTRDEQDPVSEVVNGDWHFDVIRTYSLGVEILDRRLNDGEYRLLHLLRLRASGGRNNRVTHETLAKDLGVHVKTIATRMASLKKHGYITCQKKGFNVPTLKTITSMVERYDDDILKLSRKEMLGSDRTEELLRRLHGIDNAPQDPMGAETLPMDESGSHRERKRSLEGSENAPSAGAKTLPKVNLELDELEGDPTRYARVSPPTVSTSISEESSEGDRSRTTVVHQHRDPEAETSSDERDLDAMRELAERTKATTHTKALKQVAKSRERRQRRDEDGTTEAIREHKRLTRDERLSIQFKFYEWARNWYERFFPTVVMSKWKDQQYGQFKQLMDAYSDNEPLIRKAWEYTCENWDELSRKLKIAEPAPTIGALLGYRDRIFPLVQSRETDRQFAERQPAAKGVGEW
jgi:hypothetical protein